MALTIVLATRNADKVKEIRAILSHLDIEFKDLSEFPDCPEVIEDRDTLEGNALKKAQEVAKFTGLPTVAEDTGLEVYYLLNEPGVYSARYAGEDASYDDNVRKLLKEMTQVPSRKRGARFRTVVAFIHQGKEHCFEGKVEGDILFQRQGSNGFGYDPVFRPEGNDKSFAELSTEEKNEISHRAVAIRKFAEYIASVHD
jgi:XTP/dITP diphosphohydrolase